MIDFTNNYVVNNLNPDFDLSKYYHPDMTAIDWQTLMLNSRIDNEGLIKWNDKIQLYNIFQLTFLNLVKTFYGTWTSGLRH